MSTNPFNRVGGLRPRRNAFDLSYRKNFTCDLGQLIPTMCDEVVPGDHIKLGCEVVQRFQPLVAPVMHEFIATVHFFFVPYRILFQKWQKYIKQGMLAGSAPLDIVLPTYDPTATGHSAALFTLWDYFGFPLDPGGSTPSVPSTAMWPLDFPWRAYNKILNEYYADENLNHGPLDSSGNPTNPVDEFWSPDSDTYWRTPLQNDVALRSWKKDYFTAALPFRQKGQAPALPVNLSWNTAVPAMQDLPLQFAPGAYLGYYGNPNANVQLPDYTKGQIADPGTLGYAKAQASSPDNVISGQWNGDSGVSSRIYANGQTSIPPIAPNSSGAIGVSMRAIVDQLTRNQNITTFNVSDLRLSFQIQKWLERNARAGTRYTEFLQSHFGVSPTDARLDRPEYIGGIKLPVVINEIVQTSANQGAQVQGNMAGHGLGASGDYVGKYNVQEFGLIMGIYSCLPKPGYQNGINRQWLRRLPTDFYFPEFAHLSEQGVYEAEVFATFGRPFTVAGNPIKDSTVFGFMGQYDEMRSKSDMVCSEMRYYTPASGQSASLGYWNLIRKFDSPPLLNDQFIACNPALASMRRMYAVDKDGNGNNIPGLIVNVAHHITAIRPLPLIAEPGLVDHF